MERKKVEFIESYIKTQGGDYQWSDNHGELIRCKDCVHYDEDGYCERQWATQGSNWFCGDGERKGGAELGCEQGTTTKTGT